MGCLRYLFFLTFFSAIEARIEEVDFNKSMQYDSDKQQNNSLRFFCKQLYDRNKSLKPEKDALIPKVVHLIWVGPFEPPQVFTKCLESIKRFMPDWHLMIWGDKEIEELCLDNKLYYDAEESYGAKADIARYEILYRFGGVYLDVDFVLLKSLDDLHHTYDFYTGMMPANCDAIITNGIIGAAPMHPILKNTIEEIKNNRDLRSIITRTGPIHFEKSFFKVTTAYSCDRIISLPRSFFFPLDKEYRNLNQKQIDELIMPEAFAVHFWAGSWVGSWPGRLVISKEVSKL